MAGNKNALGSTKVRKSLVEYVNIYEVTESELNSLESGGKGGVYLDFAIAGVSIAITCLTALFTCSFKQSWMFDIFICLSIVGFWGGILLLILWHHESKSVKKVIATIKDRLKEDNEQK